MRGGPGMGGGDRGDRENGDEMIEMIKERATGKETIIVPVGIKMLKFSSEDTEQRKREMIEANLSDIKSDSIITVWLNGDITDRQIADFVLIR
jgi:hypothetical protein